MINNKLSKEALVNKVKLKEKIIGPIFDHLSIFALDQDNPLGEFASL